LKIRFKILNRVKIKERIGMKKIVVLLMDMQKVFLKNINKEETEKVIENQLKIFEICKKRDISVIVLEYSDSGRETVSVLRRYLEGMKVKLLKKDDQDGFTNPKLLKILRSWNAKNLVLMGALADYCVKDTAESAVKKDFEITASYDLMLSWSNFSKCKKWFEAHGGFVDIKFVKTLLRSA